MIQLLAHYVRRLLDSYRDTIRVIKHFDLIKLNGKLIILKILIIRFFYSFSFIRNFKKISYKSEKLKSKFFLEKEINLFKDIKQIDEIGYSKTYTINESLKKEFLKMVFSCKDLDFKKLNLDASEIMKKNNEDINQYFSRLKQKKVSKVIGYLDLKKDTILRDFLTSKEMLTFVKNYLNSDIASITASFFISNPVTITEKDKYSNAQYFHWDNDFKKFLKLYIYLTDVDHESGPHLYVEKSHKFKKKEHRLCRLFSDSNIYQNYNNIKEFNGKAGSSFFVDSYGLHKGKEPKKNSRILLNIHFGSDKIFYTPNDIIIKL
jgi:hypothetical protein